VRVIEDETIGKLLYPRAMPGLDWVPKVGESVQK